MTKNEIENAESLAALRGLMGASVSAVFIKGEWKQGEGRFGR
jgi:hypothetical protein